MKQVVSVRLGPRSADHDVTTRLLGESLRIPRFGEERDAREVLGGHRPVAAPRLEGRADR